MKRNQTLLIYLITFFSVYAQNYWIPINNGLIYTQITSINCDKDIIYCGTNGGLFLSSTGGSDWRYSNSCGSEKIVEIAFDTSYIFISSASTIKWSSDGGNSWFTLIKNINCGDIAVAKNGYFFMSLYKSLYPFAPIAGIHVNEQRDSTWSYCGPPIVASAFEIWIDKSDCIYVSLYGLDGGVFLGVYYSSNYGVSWNERNDGLLNKYVICLKSDAQENLYAGTHAGIFHSTNKGINWFSDGMSNSIVYDMVIDNNSYVYIATSLGVYFSTNYGQIWNLLGDLNNSIPSALCMDSLGYIYVGTNQGLFKSLFSTLTSIKDDSKIQTEFSLFQNYPNPFNPSTRISWQSPVSTWQTLRVYDVLGNEIATLVDEYKPAGRYEVEFNASSGIMNLASGIYFYQLKVGDFVQTKKMILMR